MGGLNEKETYEPLESHLLPNKNGKIKLQIQTEPLAYKRPRWSDTENVQTRKR